MKGFVEVIAIAMLVVISLILFSGNISTGEENNAGPEIQNIVFVMSSFEKTIKKAVLDCDWSGEEVLRECAMEKATEIMLRTNTEKVICVSNIESVDLGGSPKTAEMSYSCKTSYFESSKTQIRASKTITLKDIYGSPGP